jgi:CheY-like chemotaxis protein
MIDRDIEEIRELKILYVEDNPIVRVSMSEMLRDIFDTIDTASNGEEGLEIYQRDSSYYNIIITDISMPKLDGVRMSQRILAINPKQSIIAITAYNDIKKIKNLRDIGIRKTISKPIVIEELIGAIRGIT